MRTDLDFISGKEVLKRIKRSLRQNWPLLPLIGIVVVMFFYNLQNWEIFTLEELTFYHLYTTDWINSRFNSFYFPTFLLMSMVPIDDPLNLRYFIAFLSLIGVVFYYKAVEAATGNRLVAFTSGALIATNTTIAWNSRHMAFFWSVLTLSALTIYIHIRYRDEHLMANSAVMGLSVINFAQAIFFVFPFIAAQLSTLYNEVSYRKLVIAIIFLGLLLIPSMVKFTSTQSSYAKSQHGKYNESEVDYRVDLSFAKPLIASITKKAPSLFQIGGSFEILLFFDPDSALNALRADVTRAEYGHFNSNNKKTSISDPYTYLTLALILFPLFFISHSDWIHGRFFAVGALLSFLMPIIFPVQTDLTYFFGFYLFLYPLLSKSLVDKNALLKITGTALTILLVSTQAADTFDMVSHDKTKAVDESLEGYSRIAVTPTARDILNYSRILDSDTSRIITVKCAEPSDIFDSYNSTNVYVIGGWCFPGSPDKTFNWVSLYYRSQ